MQWNNRNAGDLSRPLWQKNSIASYFMVKQWDYITKENIQKAQCKFIINTMLSFSRGGEVKFFKWSDVVNNTRLNITDTC